MRSVLAAMAALLPLLLLACGAAPLPREAYWRLSLPGASGPAAGSGAVLRVHDLQLGNALQGDCLLVAEGPTRLLLREHDRWIAPLDRLVTDAVVLGLSRTGRFRLVKGAGDAGTADADLHGRILDFAETVHGDRRSARAAIEFWLEQDGEVRMQGEFAAEVPLDSADAPAAVAALSLALQQVVDAMARRLPGPGAADRAAADAEVAADAAAPGR